MIGNIVRLKPAALFPVIRSKKFDYCYLRVTYGKDLENSGRYTSAKDASEALKAFTSWELVKEMEQWPSN